MADPLSQMLQAEENNEDTEDISARISPTCDPDAGGEIKDCEETTKSPPIRSNSSSSYDHSLVSKIEAEIESEAKDLSIVVDNPEKHVKAMESYVTFQVKTKTTRSEYEDPEYCVRRRYNDFLWLHSRLEEKHPTLIVPPLPEKHRMMIDRFEQDFVRLRQVALHTFMGRLAQHPILSLDGSLQSFLTLKESDFSAHVKKASSSGGGGGGLLSRVAGSLQGSSAAALKGDDAIHSELLEYAQSFGDKMGNMERVAQRLLQEQSGYATVLSDWIVAFDAWAEKEDKLTQALKSIARSTEKCLAAHQSVIDKTQVHILLPVKEYAQFADAIKLVLKRREAQQTEFEALSEELTRKRQALEAASGDSAAAPSFLTRNPEEARQARVAKLEQQISELAKQVDQANDRLTVANAELKADVQRWHLAKKHDVKELFVRMAERHMAMYDECIRAWEGAVPLIRDSDLSAEIRAF